MRMLSAARTKNIRGVIRTWDIWTWDIRTGNIRTGDIQTLAGKRRRQFFTGCGQIFRQHAGFPHGGHETGVARPPRQPMHVNVTGDAGAGRLADIETEIQPVRAVNLSQRRLAALGQPHHLFKCRDFSFDQARYVRIGRDHQMAARIRVTIQQHKTSFRTQHY